MKRILEGLNILDKYYDEDDSNFEAAHDQIWAGGSAEDAIIDKEDLEKLDELNWFIDEDYDSWSHFC
jgi:hypothetical protein